MTETLRQDHITEDMGKPAARAPEAPVPPPAPQQPVRYLRPPRDSWSVHGWAGLDHLTGTVLKLLLIAATASVLASIITGRLFH